MQSINTQQQKVIADFIQISRKEFGLSHCSARLGASFRRSSCNLLLITGSVFGAFSAPTYADDVQTEISVVEHQPGTARK